MDGRAKTWMKFNSYTEHMEYLYLKVGVSRAFRQRWAMSEEQDAAGEIADGTSGGRDDDVTGGSVGNNDSIQT